MTRVLPRRTGLVLVAMLSVSSRAAAQIVPESGIDVNVDVFGGWDVALGEAVTEEPEPEPGGPTSSSGVAFGGVNGTAAMRYEGREVTFEAIGNVSARSVSDLEGFENPGFGGVFRLGNAGQRRLSWSVAETLIYGPVNALSFFPGEGAMLAPIVDYRIATTEQLTSDTMGNITYGLSRNGEFRVSGIVSFNQAPLESGSGTYRRFNVAARYSHRVSRYASLYAGYGFWNNDVGSLPSDIETPDAPDAEASPPAAHLHNIDIGVDYRRSISFSRRTSLYMQGGSAAIRDTDQHLRYEVIGSAGLQHQIGRTWNLNGSYERAIRFVPTFADPLLLSGFTAQATGRVSRFSALRFYANLTKGNLGGVPGETNSVDTSSVSAQYRYALARRVGIYAEYFYFSSALGSSVVLPGALPNDARRNGFRVGLSFGTTLLGERR